MTVTVRDWFRQLRAADWDQDPGRLITIRAILDAPVIEVQSPIEETRHGIVRSTWPPPVGGVDQLTAYRAFVRLVVTGASASLTENDGSISISLTAAEIRS